MGDERDAVDIEIEDPADAEEGDTTAGKTDTDAEVAGSSETEVNTAAGAGDGDDSPSSESDTDLTKRLESADEDLAAAVTERLEQLGTERDEAQQRVDDLEGQLKRTRADFQNYKKRAKKRQESIQERATEDLVERLVPVRDNLQRALDQDADADIRGGVESTLTELDRVLEEENVEPIEPDPGQEVDPHRHEVLMRVESEQPAETIAESYRPGYEMGDKVLREAQVTVSDGDGDAGDN